MSAPATLPTPGMTVPSAAPVAMAAPNPMPDAVRVIDAGFLEPRAHEMSARGADDADARGHGQGFRRGHERRDQSDG